MNKQTFTSRIAMLTVSAALACSAIVMTPGISMAKGGGGQPRHRGFVTARPAGKVGTWVIGGKSFRAVASTQLDQLEGKLTRGRCAKVKYRAGTNIAIEIDSEPASDC